MKRHVLHLFVDKRSVFESFQSQSIRQSIVTIADPLNDFNEYCKNVLIDSTVNKTIFYFNETIKQQLRQFLVPIDYSKIIGIKYIKTIKISGIDFCLYDSLTYGNCLTGSLSTIIFGNPKFHPIIRMAISYSIDSEEQQNVQRLYRYPSILKCCGFITDIQVKKFGQQFGFKIYNIFDLGANYTVNYSTINCFLRWDKNIDRSEFHVYPLIESRKLSKH
jgi:hypothetical protein